MTTVIVPDGSAVIIAIDGPTASGKGTLAKRVAAHYGFAHLDTGALYRAVAWHLLDEGRLLGESLGLDDNAAAERIAEAHDLTGIPENELRGDKVSAAASVVAANPRVRAALLDYQRRFAAAPPQGRPGAVLDGRDIGTVICPDADVKLYVTASLDARADRRTRELQARLGVADFETVRAGIEARDTRDRDRPIAPLRPADDAHLLDTTHLDIDAAFAAARAIIDRVLSQR